ncbi:hypothetical protein WA158_006543 [Blastocystis sp. Blastoise]
MISQFFILSDRGDRLIYKDFRFDVPITACEKFLRTVRFWPGDAPPIFNKDAVTYLFSKKNGIYFVITTKMNLSPCYGTEVLFRIIKIIKDYCGVLSEDSIRKNFILIYELLEELIDFGYPQDTSTTNLKTYVFSKPVQGEDSASTSVTAANKSIVSNNKKSNNEIFVDCTERLSIMFNSKGNVLHSSIDGSIVMRSFLTGNPTVKILLPAHLVVGKDSPLPPADEKNPTVILDDMNFDDSVNLEQFDEKRLLTLVPQEGEFTVLNYRTTSYYKPPFTVYAMVEEKSPTKIEVIVKLVVALPADVSANNVFVSLHAPVDTTTCNITIAPNAQQQLKEYREKEKRVFWMLKKVTGAQEHYLKIIYNLEKPANQFITKEIGPILCNFEIPNFQLSGMKIRGLSIDSQQKNYNPQRWLRYNTVSNSYCTRI